MKKGATRSSEFDQLTSIWRALAGVGPGWTDVIGLERVIRPIKDLETQRTTTIPGPIMVACTSNTGSRMFRSSLPLVTGYCYEQYMASTGVSKLVPCTRTLHRTTMYTSALYLVVQLH